MVNLTYQSYTLTCLSKLYDLSVSVNKKLSTVYFVWKQKYYVFNLSLVVYFLRVSYDFKHSSRGM